MRCPAPTPALAVAAAPTLALAPAPALALALARSPGFAAALAGSPAVALALSHAPALALPSPQNGQNQNGFQQGVMHLGGFSETCVRGRRCSIKGESYTVRMCFA